MKKSIEWFLKAANNGSSDAQFQLGVAYISGSAGRVNINESCKWLEQALANGNADAGMFLGMLFAEGISVEKTQINPINITRRLEKFMSPRLLIMIGMLLTPLAIFIGAVVD